MQLLVGAVWQDRHSCRVGSSRPPCFPRPCFSLPSPFISHPSCACMCACVRAYMYMCDQPLLFEYRKTDSEFCDNHVCTGGSFTCCAVCLVRCCLLSVITPALLACTGQGLPSHVCMYVHACVRVRVCVCVCMRECALSSIVM